MSSYIKLGVFVCVVICVFVAFHDSFISIKMSLMLATKPKNPSKTSSRSYASWMQKHATSAQKHALSKIPQQKNVTYNLPKDVRPEDARNIFHLRTGDAKNTNAKYQRDISLPETNSDYQNISLQAKKGAPRSAPKPITIGDVNKRVRLLIFVMACKDCLYTRTIYVKRTWGKRADKMIYFSEQPDKNFPTVKLGVHDTSYNLLAKTMKSLRYIYRNHIDDYDWFVKADDDTFLIVENLRHFLADKNTSEPVYYGQLMKSIPKRTFGAGGHWSIGTLNFFSGGAGYVLSKEALRRAASEKLDSKKCRQYGSEEDVKLAWCLNRLGVVKGATTDDQGRSRFHGIPPEKVLGNDLPSWYREMVYKVTNSTGRDSISQYPVSFHQITGEKMLLLDFLLYYAKPYGVELKHEDHADPARSKPKLSFGEKDPTEGRNMTLTCKTSTQVDSYQFFKDDEPISSILSQNTLVIKHLHLKNNSRRYSCKTFIGDVLSDTSEAVPIVVLPAPPTLKADALDATIERDTIVTLTCSTSTNDTNIIYTFIHNHIDIKQPAPSISNVFTIKADRVNYSYSFQCKTKVNGVSSPDSAELIFKVL